MTAIIRCQCGWPSTGDTVSAARLKLEAHTDECPDYRGINSLRRQNDEPIHADD